MHVKASTIALAGKQYMQPSGENPGTCPNDVINTCFCRPGLKGCKNDNECPYSEINFIFVFNHEKNNMLNSFIGM